MTRFAEPEVIACPYCEQRFLRRVMCSFNSMWQITYSDGGTRGGFANIIVNESRCTTCQKIIENIEDIPAIDIKPIKPFWQKWFAKHEEYLYLPNASTDVYIELFKRTLDIDQKRDFAVQAYRLFNQSYRMYGKERKANENERQCYGEITDFILAHPTTPIIDEYSMLCADIYRLRGDFLRSKQMYDTVSGEKFDYIVEQGKRWCELSNTSLMEIHDKAELHEVGEAI